MESLVEQPQNLKEQISFIQTIVTEIRGCLLGTEYTKKKGLVDRADDHETRIEKLETKLNKAAWVSIGAGLGGGIALSKLVSILTEIFKH